MNCSRRFESHPRTPEVNRLSFMCFILSQQGLKSTSLPSVTLLLWLLLALVVRARQVKMGNGVAAFFSRGLFWSQYHRKVEAGRDHWGSSSPTSLLKQGHPGHITQDCLQTALEHLQGKRLHNLSRQPISVLSHPHSKKSSSLGRTPCILVYAHCLLLYCLAPPRPILLTPSLQISLFFTTSLVSVSNHLSFKKNDAVATLSACVGL